MSQWFRMYAEVLEDPKVQRLSGDDFKGWVNLLCLTAKHDGLLPDPSDIAFALRIDEKKAAKLVDRMISAGLLVREETGLKPHKWDQRQYKSDVSTDRVKRFRERSKKQSGTETETAPEAETDTETEAANAASAGEREADSEKQGVDLADLTSKISTIAGVPISDWGDAARSQAIVQGWLDAGADPDFLTQTVTSRKSTTRSSPKSLQWFDGAVREAISKRKDASSALNEATGSIIDRVLGRTAA